MENTEERDVDTPDFKLYRKQVIIIGIVVIGSAIFGYFQLSFFNTYVEHVLDLSPLHIALMVSLASTVALFFLLFWGVISDNTRTKYGRRRPYLLLGIISGISMILFGFITDFYIGLIIRVLLLETTINGFYAVQRTLTADIIPVEHRGKANGITANMGLLGMIVAIGATVIVNDTYVSHGKLSQEGHLFLYLVGGISIIICIIIGFIFLEEPLKGELPERKTFIEDLRETLQIQELKKHKEYFKMMLAQAVLFFGLMMIAPFIFIYVFGLELTTLEWAITVLIVGPVLGITTYALGKIADNIGRKRVIPPVILLSSIGFWMIPFVGVRGAVILPLLIAAVTLALIGFNGILVPINAWQQDLLPEDKRAQFNGIINVMYTLLSIPGAFLGGLVYMYMGIEWIFAFIPLFLLASIPFFLRIEETLPEK